MPLKGLQGEKLLGGWVLREGGAFFQKKFLNSKQGRFLRKTALFYEGYCMFIPFTGWRANPLPRL